MAISYLKIEGRKLELKLALSLHKFKILKEKAKTLFCGFGGNDQHCSLLNLCWEIIEIIVKLLLIIEKLLLCCQDIAPQPLK